MIGFSVKLAMTSSEATGVMILSMEEMEMTFCGVDAVTIC
jgi:hypothetical protein